MSNTKRAPRAHELPVERADVATPTESGAKPQALNSAKPAASRELTAEQRRARGLCEACGMWMLHDTRVCIGYLLVNDDGIVSLDDMGVPIASAPGCWHQHDVDVRDEHPEIGRYYDSDDPRLLRADGPEPGEKSSPSERIEHRDNYGVHAPAHVRADLCTDGCDARNQSKKPDEPLVWCTSCQKALLSSAVRVAENVLGRGKHSDAQAMGVLDDREDQRADFLAALRTLVAASKSRVEALDAVALKDPFCDHREKCSEFCMANLSTRQQAHDDLHAARCELRRLDPQRGAPLAGSRPWSPAGHALDIVAAALLDTGTAKLRARSEAARLLRWDEKRLRAVDAANARGKRAATSKKRPPSTR